MPPLWKIRSAARLGSVLLAAIVGVVLALAKTSAAESLDDLYHAKAFVTGQGESERARGFGLCLEEVLVKLSGDPALRDDRRLDRLKPKAEDLVARFAYHDRMAGLPLHDEQGTRDRPFDLDVWFDPAKTDAALSALGRRPWKGPRPQLLLLLGVKDATRAYVLTSDGERGLGERQSVAAAAARRGLPLTLPSTQAVAAAAIDYKQLKTARPSRFVEFAKSSGSAAPLLGTLVWSDAALGWVAQWRLAWQGEEHRWEVSGVSFDDAFRNAVDGAERIIFAAHRRH